MTPPAPAARPADPWSDREDVPGRTAVYHRHTRVIDAESAEHAHPGGADPHHHHSLHAMSGRATFPTAEACVCYGQPRPEVPTDPEQVRQRMLEARAAMRRLTQCLARDGGDLYTRLTDIRSCLEVEVRDWHLAAGRDVP